MITIKNLTKNYGKTSVLSDLNIDFKEATITGIIGPNGSGKTTLLKCILNMIPYNGLIETKFKNIAFVPDIDKLDYFVTGYEYLMSNSKLANVSIIKFNNSIPKYTKIFGMESYMNKLIGEYSHGTLKKLLLIEALLQSPSLLILDEPYNGLDPEYRLILDKIILKLHSIDVTLILTSHNLDQVKKMCTDVVILNKTKVFYSGSKNAMLLKFNLDQKFAEISETKGNYENIERLNDFY